MQNSKVIQSHYSGVFCQFDKKPALRTVQQLHVIQAVKVQSVHVRKRYY